MASIELKAEPGEGIGMMEIPRVGVSIEMLKRLLKEYVKEQFTTSDFCAEVVRELTKERRCSMATLVAEGLLFPELQKTAIGKPTVFVSHAWRYMVKDVIESIVQFEEAQERRVKQYYWFDVIVNSQWDTAERPFAWWTTTFRTNIAEIGHTLLVLLPWYDPIPLRRAWCLFEFLSTHTTKTKMTIVLPEAERRLMQRALVIPSEFSRVMDCLGTIDAKRSEAFLPSDKEMIFKAVEKEVEGGFHSLNSTVLQRMREWLLDSTHVALNHIEKTVNNFPNDKDARIHQATLRHGAGKLYIQLSHHIMEAEKLLKAACKARGELLGEEHLDTLESLLYLSMSQYRQGDKLDAAVENYRQCFTRYSHQHPDLLHQQTLFCMSGLSYALFRRYTVNNRSGADNNEQASTGVHKELQEAIEIADKCLHLRLTLLGSKHADTLISMNNVAMFKSHVPELVESALVTLRECADLRMETLGKRHVDTLFTRFNLAKLLQKHHHPDWFPIAKDTLLLQQQTLGANNPDALQTLALIEKEINKK